MDNVSEKTVLSKDKSSRIKFKSQDSSSRRLFLPEYDEFATDRKLFAPENFHKLHKNYLQTDRDELDSGICYHRDCCFAYNITDDARDPVMLVECLPAQIYQVLAKMWNLNRKIHPSFPGNTCRYRKEQEDEENRVVDEYIKNVERDMGMRSEVSEDMQVDKGSAEPGPGSENLEKGKRTSKRDNVYLKFLKKIETADLKKKSAPNLGKKAGKITKLIIGKFLDWYQSLGADAVEESFIDESTLQQLFKVGFEMPAAKPVAIRIKELPTIPDCIANLRNEPKHATKYALKQFLKEDIKMENIPMKMFAFGSMLPKEKNLRYKPPRNLVQQTWMECSRVPKDLSTMKTVWVGLEKLRSTIAFSNWLKNHPDITPPVFLQEKGLLNINYEEWNQMYKGFEVDVNMDVVGTTEWKGTREKSFSKASSALSNSGSMKFEASSYTF